MTTKFLQMKRVDLLAIFFMFLVLSACSKHRGDIEETIPSATISLTSPVNDAVYSKTDSILIQGTAVSTAPVHGYDITIKGIGDTTTYFFKHVHEHNDTLSIYQKWKGALEVPVSLEAQLTLYLDHDGHTETKKLAFSVQ
jgi:hypothetical protein